MTIKKPAHAEIVFDERNVPINTRFDDPYFSFQNGLAESEYVFLEGNALSSRLCDGFTIAELGFGSGLNFLLTWQLWQRLELSGELRYVSFEAYPMQREDLSRTLYHFPKLSALIALFLEHFDGQRFTYEGITLEIIDGDARDSIQHTPILADAWYLDGFSPAKNPEMWGEDLLRHVGHKTKASGTFATYSAAGHVRRKLEAAGFTVSRKKGFGHKRHMLTGVKSLAHCSE